MATGAPSPEDVQPGGKGMRRMVWVETNVARHAVAHEALVATTYKVSAEVRKGVALAASQAPADGVSIIIRVRP